MRTALTCALLAILFLGSQCTSGEDRPKHDPRVETTTPDLYELHYKNNPALCGAQYRNSSYAEPVYNCTLKNLPPIVNQTWERIRHRINKTIPEFVKLMCNLTVSMPEDFYLVYWGSSGNSEAEESRESTNIDEDSKKVSSTAVQVTPELITEAEENCTAQITGWTTVAPTTLEPTAEPQFEAIS
uniref:Anticomplement protein 3 n=1 Tax=Ixodes ricinus TaxID=34613 RepID=B6E212_IXORI|nr:anticomplement protein 3 [Ixodes ricinus]